MMGLYNFVDSDDYSKISWGKWQNPKCVPERANLKIGDYFGHTFKAIG